MATVVDDCLVRVIVKWLNTAHCPNAAHAIARSIRGGDEDWRAVDPLKPKSNSFCVHIEAVSGARLGTFKGLHYRALIRDLQAQIADRLGHEKFPIHRQFIFQAGSTCYEEEGSTLEKCGIAHGAHLTLVVRQDLQWDPAKSNPYLQFFDSNKTVARPGKASTFPLACTRLLLKLPGDSFCAQICQLPASSDAFSIGVLHAGGRMKDTATLGVGSRESTMGVYIGNVRRRLANPKARNKCIRYGGAFRGPEVPMFQQGDTIRFRLDHDVQENRLCLDFVFSGQQVHRELLPAHFALPLQPLCTLPDDCSLKLIP